VAAHFALGPLQDEVRGGHDGDLARVGVEGVLAGEQRFAPHAALPLGHQLAVAVVLAADIGALVAGVAHHHAHGAHFHHGLGNQLHRGEEAVHVVGAFHQHLVLTTPQTARPQELVRVLEVVVIRRGIRGVLANRGRDDLTAVQAGTVVDGGDAHRVIGAANDDGPEAPALGDDGAHLLEGLQLTAIQGQVVGLVLGDDDELGDVDGVGAFAQDHALGALLAAVGQEGAHILEVVGLHVARQGLGGRKILAIAGEDVPDLALGDGDEGHPVNPVHEGHEEMPAAAQHVGLETGFPIQRDEAALDGALAANEFFHDAHAGVRDVAEGLGEQDQQNDAEYKPPENAEDGKALSLRDVHECSFLGMNPV